MSSQQKVNNCHDLHSISNDTLFINEKTMEEFITPYIMKKHKEPSKKQNLKQPYSIKYANFIYLDAALL